MSKRANPALIGAFIVGAIALAVAGVVIFGSGRFLKKTDRYVIFFNGSVKGLDLGAPVSVRGVRVGSVTDVVLLVNGAKNTVDIKVIVQIEKGKAERAAVRESTHELYDKFVKAGLRAKLATDSFLTGKLYVDLDFYPDTPVNLTGLDKSIPELPTVPTDIEKIQKTVGEVFAEIRQYPIREILDKVNHTMGGVDRMVNGPEAIESLRSFRDTITNLQALVQGLESRTETMTGSLDELIRNINGRIGPLTRSLEETATDTRKMMNSIGKQVPPLATSLSSASKSAREALDQANKTLSTLERAASEKSPLRENLSDTLKELSRAARSIRVLTDYLESHPEALIRGKGEPGGR